MSKKQNTDFSALEKELGSLLLNTYGVETSVPKNCRLEVIAKLLFFRGEYRVDVKVKLKERSAYLSEILGDDVTDIDWADIFSHPTLFEPTCEHESKNNISLAKAFLEQLHKAGNQIKGEEGSYFFQEPKLLNFLFKRAGLPYRIITPFESRSHYYLGRLY